MNSQKNKSILPFLMAATMWQEEMSACRFVKPRQKKHDPNFSSVRAKQKAAKKSRKRNRK